MYKTRRFASLTLGSRGARFLSSLPSSTDVVVIGGGVVGASTAYHLAKKGVQVTLLERHKYVVLSFFIILKVSGKCTVFENHRKSLIQHCERSVLRLHFEWTKVN